MADLEQYTPVLKDVGVDWITSTTDKPEAVEKLTTRATFWIGQEANRGNEKKRWVFSGYQGFACGSVNVGIRPDGLCIRLGSHMAQRHWLEVFGVTQRCSRLDLQYTVCFDRDPRLIIMQHHREVAHYKKRHPHVGSYSMFAASDDSSTLYLGSRSSDRFARIYDKWRESKSDYFRNCVRFEAEYKNYLAVSVANFLVASSDRPSAIVGQVNQMLLERGVCLSHRGASGTHVCAPPQHSDADRVLAWLETSVRGSVQRLCDAGKLAEVLSALSLEKYLDKEQNFQTGPTAGHKNQESML